MIGCCWCVVDEFGDSPFSKGVGPEPPEAGACDATSRDSFTDLLSAEVVELFKTSAGG